MFGLDQIRCSIYTGICNPVWEKEILSEKKLSGRPYGLKDLEHHFLCLLMYYRTYTTQFFIGFLFGVDDSCVSRSIKRLEPLLAQGCRHQERSDAERRRAGGVDYGLYRTAHSTPQERTEEVLLGEEKASYDQDGDSDSGDGKITQVSPPHPGSLHDFEIYKKEKPPPRNTRTYADSGYQGLDKRRSCVEIPYKKPKGASLDAEQKEYNRALSSFRVLIENKFCELKTFKILSETYRNFRKGYGLKMNIIAGMVNVKSGF